MTPKPPPDPKTWLDERCVPEPNSGCWLWLLYTQKFGHGLRSEPAKWMPERLAHRIAYRIYFGPIPDGMCVCHRCDNPSCVNPDHLFLGTQADNLHDMMRKGRDENLRKKQSRAKLSDSDVVQLRGAARDGATPLELARRFGISRRSVYSCLHRQSYAHID